MKEDEILTPQKREMLLPIIIAQTVCVLLILLTVLTVKFFFKSTYKEVQKWYNDNICIDTNINEVLEEGESNEV